MSNPEPIHQTILGRTQDFAVLVWERFISDLLSPWAEVSLFTLGAALAIAVLWVSRGRLRSFRVLRRALFSRRWLAGPSARADWGLTLFNRFIGGSLVGWAIVSGALIGEGVLAGMVGLFGPAAQTTHAGWGTVLLVTSVLYLAYEAAYFSYHCLSHRIELLWHFHRVHHMAETLSPLTNFRVHPVDSIVFYNVIGLFSGTALGLMSYLVPGAHALELGGTNALMIVAIYLVTHLQHSHIWLPLTGTAGRLILSPAHHQLHHSDDPKHYNCNFGSTIAVFDWLAGTLVVPAARRQKLKFGAGPYPVDPHSISGTLVQPFVEAARPLQDVLRRIRRASPAQA